MEKNDEELEAAMEEEAGEPPEHRARQNGDHRDHRSRKVLIFDGKFYLNFMRFCLHFDGKRVFVTETNILLLTI